MTLKQSLIALLLLILISAQPAFAKKQTITDVMGREITVNLPAHRVFLGFYYTDYLAIGGPRAFDNIIGFSRAVWENWTPASWNLYKKAIPKLEQLADAGEFESGTFSIEKLLAMRPDIVILAKWQFETLGEELEQMEKAGIKVIVVDYNDETLKNHLLSTRILGQIAGHPERAEEIAIEYEHVSLEIAQRLKKANLPKPKIYIEFGNQGPEQHGLTYGKNMWGAK